MNRTEIDKSIYTIMKKDLDDSNINEGFSCINYNTKQVTMFASYIEHVDYIKRNHRNNLLRKIRVI